MNTGRREFLGQMIGMLAATRFGPVRLNMPGSTMTPELAAVVASRNRSPFDAIKQVDAGVLNVGYAELGPANGRAVVLLHGWPYDIHAFEEVAPLLAARGYRVIVPHLRGFGTTLFHSGEIIRNGEQAAIALDTVDLMNSLNIQNAIVGGFDWGSRTAGIMAALWPDRVKGLVAVSGYIMVNLKNNLQPLPPKAELGWWYQYYFATERGRLGYANNTYDFNKLIWQLASPKWNFDEATYARSAASFNNPDHVRIVIHNYRWRLSVAEGESRYSELEQRIFARPAIPVPSITIGSDFDGAAADGKAYADRFVGRHEHRVLNGIGHNVPQEAPQDFAQAIIDVDVL